MIGHKNNTHLGVMVMVMLGQERHQHHHQGLEELILRFPAMSLDSPHELRQFLDVASNHDKLEPFLVGSLGRFELLDEVGVGSRAVIGPQGSDVLHSWYRCPDDFTGCLDDPFVKTGLGLHAATLHRIYQVIECIARLVLREDLMEIIESLYFSFTRFGHRCSFGRLSSELIYSKTFDRICQ